MRLARKDGRDETMRRNPKRALLVGFAAAFAWTLSLRIHPMTIPPSAAPGAAPALAGSALSSGKGSRAVVPSHPVGATKGSSAAAPSTSAPTSAPRSPTSPSPQGPLQFHVVANSNRPSDQAAKLAVRSRTLATLAPSLESAVSEDQALRRAERLAPLLQTEADAILQELGRSYDARVVVGKAWVPDKTWGSVQLPAGVYPTLTILLGRAQGQNWWCVVFPPLCLVNPTAAVIQNVPPTGPEELGQAAMQGKARGHVVKLEPKAAKPARSFLGELLTLLFG